jgi:hypothetical protein
MNLALHLGWLGALEAGALAFLIGLVAYAIWHPLGRRLQWPEGRAIGWAGFSAVVVGGGVDLWHLFSLFFVNPGSPAYVQQALTGIHDPDGLGTRVVMEVLGALGGVLLAWIAFEALGTRKPHR